MPKLYVGKVDQEAIVPYAWIRRGSEGPLLSVAARDEATVYLDLYARSSSEAQIMENAAAFLDDYNAPPYGNALSIRYRLASKTQLSEAETREHVTILYSVRYGDKRKTP